MFWKTEKRIRRKIEKAKAKAAKMILNCPKEYLNQDFLIKIQLNKYCYMNFNVTNVQECRTLAKERADERHSAKKTPKPKRTRKRRNARR